jgi:hypothetical protein
MIQEREMRGIQTLDTPTAAKPNGENLT